MRRAVEKLAVVVESSEPLAVAGGAGFVQKLRVLEVNRFRGRAVLLLPWRVGRQELTYQRINLGLALEGFGWGVFKVVACHDHKAHSGAAVVDLDAGPIVAARLYALCSAGYAVQSLSRDRYLPINREGFDYLPGLRCYRAGLWIATVIEVHDRERVVGGEDEADGIHLAPS